ncbi:MULTISPECIES: hypothetical protein [unclassified Thiocapsa]|uniref:hypothetical protein n=1 Tax=unclassified Thiocapsa TaxID=2641286 RepID=UPI0035B25980
MLSRGQTKALILILFLLGYWAVGLYPFTFEPSKYVVNQAERTADGGLSFPGVGIARTPCAPGWLNGIQDANALQVLVVAPHRRSRSAGAGPSLHHLRRNLPT